MATLELYLETGDDGGCLFYTFDPPGLLAWGACLESTLSLVPAAACRFRRLLESAGALRLLVEVWEERETPEIVIAETFRRRGKVANGGTRATFQRDLVPVRRDELPAFLDLMVALRAEFWSLRERIPPGAYGFRSLPHRMTIGEQLRHVAGCDRWYLSRFFGDLPRLPRSRDVWHKLELNRERALATIAGMTAADLGRVVKVDGQVWTARKLIRRFLYHERFHQDTIERDLALYLDRQRPAPQEQ